MALELSNNIDLLVEDFPKKELYNLTSQFKRAADSVVLNIAEGSTGKSIPVFKRYLDIALRSAIEVVACLFIAQTRKYIPDETFRNFYNEYEVLCKMITRLRNSI